MDSCIFISLLKLPVNTTIKLLHQATVTSSNEHVSQHCGTSLVFDVPINDGNVVGVVRHQKILSWQRHRASDGLSDNASLIATFPIVVNTVL